MEKMRMETENLVDENIKKLMELFPGVVTETVKDGKVERAVDFDALKQELSDVVVEGNEERYQFTWPDKKKARLLANTPIRATLRPCKEESVDFDTTQNLYIEGDNLDVLKLMRETYLGKIKMIYIDPPYNTGNDFVYADNFAMSVDEYNSINGDYDDQGNRLVQNTESNGRYHTDWLNMIYPRIKISKDLLSDDGVIFISIDDNELDNLKKICGEIFGDKNFIACFTWVKKKKGSHLSKTVRNMTEYILCYSKNYSRIELYGEKAYSDKLQPLAKKINARKTLSFKSGVVKTTLKDGTYRAGIYGESDSALDFKTEIKVKDGVIINPFNVYGPFIWTQEKLDSELGLGTEVYLSSKFGINVLRADQENKIKRPTTILDAKSEIGTNEDAYDEITSIFGHEAIMSYPKPISLIEYLVRSISFVDKDPLILDFFSGSATTAYAVMKLNAEDGGNRKFIMVQLPEICGEDTKAYEAGYKTICEIGKERIRRAGKKIKEDAGLMAQDLDIGMRVLKLDSSNMKDVYYKADETSQQRIDDILSNVKEDRTSMDLLFQVMLEKGKLLSSRIEGKTVEGKMVYVVNDNDLICCFDKDIGDDVVKAIAQMKPLYAVFRDSSFKSDDTMTNAEQYFRTYSPNTELSII